ncbi:hypothetical protein KI387_015281 [Taxus chinensis]|uniref:F-box/kelch-repeat protein n=1 Tax=Taxus chinensis TaxID=29808 RepID=A0AA38GF48_TAXCH|nr:hypothetical protein KI387_015281 [Taxus chinensis]
MENAELVPGLPWHMAVQCLARAPLTSLWGVCPAWQELLYTSEFFQRLRSDLGMPAFQWLYALLHTDEGVLCWSAYDPLASTWHLLPPMPDDVEFQLSGSGCNRWRSHPVQCVSTPGKLVVVAGSKSGGRRLQPALDRPLVFEAEERRWRRGAPFRVPRRWCVCGGVEDNKVFVASGCGVEWDVAVSKLAEIYDVDADAWGPAEAVRSSKFSGEGMSAVAVAGKLHMVSGKGVMIRDGAVYDPAGGVWSKMSPSLLNGWTDPCVGMDERFYALEESSGRLKAYNSLQETWVTVVESRGLQRVSQLVGSEGRICGIIAGEMGIVVVDLAAKPVPRVLEVDTPMGCPVAIHVLRRMGHLQVGPGYRIPPTQSPQHTITHNSDYNRGDVTLKDV